MSIRTVCGWKTECALRKTGCIGAPDFTPFRGIAGSAYSAQYRADKQVRIAPQPRCNFWRRRERRAAPRRVAIGDRMRLKTADSLVASEAAAWGWRGREKSAIRAVVSEKAKMYRCFGVAAAVAGGGGYWRIRAALTKTSRHVVGREGAWTATTPPPCG
ncbi:hypothetical protein V9T40_004588 [Parthenolecanium corni]|uniref:Uncharacterized protein n=1 Tax=Parthenolecanium corni TaxID=536013 RepID=A0AAN9TWU0_9HEMI